MPTSHPWNPNPDVSDEDRARGYWIEPCYAELCGPDCLWCFGSGKVRRPVPEYRPDKKIRAIAWLPHGKFHMLFWDEGTLNEFEGRVRSFDHYTTKVRGWDRETYAVRPSAVSLFRRTDS